MLFGRKKNHQRKSSCSHYRPPAEVLEVRSMLSATLSGGVLNIVEGSKADTVNVSLVANDATKLDVCENGRHRLFGVNQVTSIKANLGGGNDLFEIDQRNGQITLPTTILGGKGNDTLIGGGGIDNIDGGAGDDLIRGQAGNDVLNGNEGNDDIGGGNGMDQISGGGGNDAISGGAGSDSISGGTGDDVFDSLDAVSELRDQGTGTDSAATAFNSVPNAVQNSVNGLLHGAVATSFITEYTGADTVYEVEWTADGINRSAVVNPSGTITEETQEIDFASLPLDVTHAVHARYRSGKITGAALRTTNGVSGYEVIVTNSRVTHEMLLSETGQILEDEVVQHVNQPNRFRAFTASGATAFSNLNPGSVLVLEGPDKDGNPERLVITVLDAVKFVDGVETRVVEERAFINGELIEVAKNYFAADKKTGNVYYFGEEVDNYDNGRIKDHHGSWQSGISGAKFGLLVPGAPRVGFSYVEENAPGIAQDRGHIDSTTESVSTEAGNFTGVIKVRETSPLDTTLDFKYYAKGIGLVQSNQLKLVSYTLK